ncbi:FAS1-like dehydratase domain-containing protein [Pararhodobacter sp.]|uniref:FAS1-like dehydratase domain-containing protein n=1 Tax=Pararhodobacter sp. TaxID=2127056 RepID=UPI002FDE35E4
MTLDVEHLKSWIGAARESEDEISPRLANSLAAVLDEPVTLQPGDPAPAGVHWCLSPEIAPMQRLGPDGHPARGDFLPPVPLPRRMWAGGELAFHGDFRVGDLVRRHSRVADVSVKEGRTGTLCFVEVRHDYHSPRGLALSERHDIVYRGIDAPPGATPDPAAQPVPDARLTIDATPVLLMRYSAATFNGHRIHYDREYCRSEEHYPGLIVHGPLQATYLLRMAGMMMNRPLPARFTFRGTAPLFDGGTFSVNGCHASDTAQADLWIADARGVVTMRASAA